MEKAPTYDAERSKAFTWAVMIFRNKAIDRIRSRQRRTRITERAAQDLTSLFNPLSSNTAKVSPSSSGTAKSKMASSN